LLDYDRIEARALTKTWGPTRALMSVDLSLPAGACTVIEGPNGAGKSTLVGILSLLSRPTKGTLRFGEHDALTQTEALRGSIGVLAHAAMVYPDLTGLESLMLAAELYGVADGKSRVSALRDRFDIGTFAERPTRTYSRGQLQRIALARALLHEPRLLLLDEPSTGLDVKATERLVTAVDAERARGAIVVLVTHDPVLAERCADHRVLLERGRRAGAAA
jgi:ABC-type multidrug transport system ATPase subunit